MEEEFDDGGVRELDNYFEGTKLAFVDYIQPRAIVQKGFKKMALAIVPGAKPSKYKGNLPTKKTSAVENTSKSTDKDLLSSNGSFIDSNLESNYANYLSRKAKKVNLIGID
ncbi:hypothetical protein [Sporosarcina psychrophila]|uniref:Uncharacterized protein n=2 Tax=Sporosarcina psychrophila TaxID=1476 RepID=A0ABV2K5E1_SPOPS